MKLSGETVLIAGLRVEGGNAGRTGLLKGNCLCTDSRRGRRRSLDGA